MQKRHDMQYVFPVRNFVALLEEARFCLRQTTESFRCNARIPRPPDSDIGRWRPVEITRGPRIIPDNRTSGPAPPHSDRNTTMTSLRQARERAFHAQQGYCCYCGYPMAESTAELDAFARRYKLKKPCAQQLLATAEHLLARCDGGTDRAANIAAAHACCNRLRHHRKCATPPDKYREHVQRRCAKGRWHAPQVLRMSKRLPPLPS